MARESGGGGQNWQGPVEKCLGITTLRRRLGAPAKGQAAEWVIRNVYEKCKGVLRGGHEGGQEGVGEEVCAVVGSKGAGNPIEVGIHGASLVPHAGDLPGDEIVVGPRATNGGVAPPLRP
eukprot:Sspe_Gene.39000::Locus_18819_Transcript_1_1_Confidence_1.000_Length_499::g.39000::m.39000